MKKKLLTLLTLLVVCVTGTWAQTTLFLWQSDGSTTAKETELTCTGGTAAFYGSANPSTESAAYNAAVTDNELKATGSKGHKLGTNSLYLKVTLTGGNKLQAGDIIYVCGYNPFKVGTSQSGNVAATDLATSLTTGTSKTDYNVGTITVPSTIGSNVTEIYLSRAEGTSTGLAAVKIVRPVADDRPAAPISWSAESFVATLGESNTFPTLTNTENLTVAYSSSTTSVATIDAQTGTITLVAKGTTTISATYTAVNGGDYKTTKVSYNLTVTNLAVISDETFNFSDSDWDNVFTSSASDATITSHGMEFLKGLKYQDLSSSKENDGLTFTREINTGGSSDNTKRTIHLVVTPNSKVSIYARPNGDGRSVTISNGSYGSSDKTELNMASAAEVYKVSHINVFGGDVYIYGGASINFLAVKVEPYSPAPEITTQPIGASYVTGDPIAALTVEAVASAGDLSYQWYKCDDANKTNASAIDGATSASYTPSETGFYYVKVTDSNGSVDSDVVEVSISAAVEPTISVSGAPSAAVAKGTAVTLTATVTGNPEPTVQWYRNATASTTGGTAIEGATNTTYSPATTTVGTFYYYAVASNGVGTDATSELQTITVTGSNACKLLQVVYSNSFDAFINEPTAEVLYEADDDEVKAGTAEVGDVKTPAANGTVKAYYMEGTTIPTISSNQVVVSADATYNITGNQITVTAEDGTTTALYDITVEAVAPYESIGKLTFDGTETWVKTGNAFSEVSGKVGWVFSKNDSDWSRETPGKNRIYFFLAPSVSITLENGGTARNIKVYKNGTLLTSPTSTSSCTIEGDTENAYMIAVVSNQTSGDGAFKSITVTPENVSATISPTGWSTYCSPVALDFTSVSDLEAYIATGVEGTTVTTSPLEGTVPASTPLLLKGIAEAEYTIPVVASSTTVVTGNKLVAGTGAAVAKEDGVTRYVLSANEGKAVFKMIDTTPATVPVGKAYLEIEISGNPPAPMLSFYGDGETTGIRPIDNGQLIMDNVIYDLSGRRVENPTKGVYIMNGKKVVVK